MSEEEEMQVHIMENGCIAPCPYTEECINYPTGCKGGCYWCKKYDKDKIKL